MSCFSNEFNKSKEFQNLSKSVNTLNAPVGVIGLSDVAKCFAAHSLCQNGEKAFVITPDEATAVKVQECLSELQDGVLLYPRMFAFESILAGANLTIAVRANDIPAANLIKKEISEKLQKNAEVITLDEVEGEFDLLINGTPVGMYPKVDASVLPKEKVEKCKAVFDAVYNPQETLILKYAKDSGIKYSNGLPMLVWQAAVAQEIWFDIEFSMDEIKKVLKITQEEMEKI